ncbi:MAG: hypothetical protein AAGD35_19700 [Actinomycetota bacterium]
MSIPLPPQPRRRFSAAEAKAALLDAGAELLAEVGLESGLARVSFGAAVERSGVPRPSAYRIFSNGDFDPQEQYRMSLLLHLLDQEATRDRTKSTNIAEESLVDLSDHVGSRDPDRMAFAFRETVRRISNAVWAAAGIEEAAYLAAAISLAVDPTPYPPLLDAYRRHRKAAVQSQEALYQLALTTFGLRLRAPFTVNDHASLVAMSLDQAWDGRLVYGREPTFQRATGLNGELMAWTPFGISCEGLLLVTTESDPEAEVSARLSSWLET